jgi:chemotaxis protein histidine kinase CheA/ActR/RegA family two-component response regulator
MGDRSAAPTRVTNELSPEALEVFREEAQEHLLTITTGIASLEANPHDTGSLQSVRRATHTLKGAAGMMGFTAIQQLAHASEDLLDRLVEGSIALTPDLVGLLLDTADMLDQLARGLLTDDADQQQAQRGLIERYTRVTGKSVMVPAAISSPAHQRGESVTIATADEVDDPNIAAGAADKTDLSVRLQLSKLDDLVNLFGELLVNRSVLEERVDRLSRMVGDSALVGERLRDVGGQLETRFEAATLPSGRGGPNGAAGRGALWANASRQGTNGTGHDFDELELDRYTEFHRLSRGLSEGVVDIVTLTHEMEAMVREVQTAFSRETRLSSDFQDRLLRARLVPLQSLMPRLYRAARTSAAREGKEIEFYTEGADIEVDRKVFEEVTGPLLHMVRNAVNHALERPEERVRANKPRAGTITVSTSYEGNQVVIAVRDDGAGIDPESVRKAAIARGLIDAYTPLSEQEAINLIFRQGFSTAATVNEESGRGVGLDVVRDAVTRLRGTIEVDSKAGQGTTFTMKFPISLQIARAVLVRIGGQTYAIPMAVVDQIGRLDYYSRSPGDPPTIEMRGERYALAHLGQYLHVPYPPVEDRASVLLVNAGTRRVALLVDAIVAQQEIVSKPLGPHLRDVRGVAGAAVLGNGQVVVIVELNELLADEPQGTLSLPTPGVRPSAAPSPRPASSTASLPSGSYPTVAPPSAPTPVAVPAADAPAAARREFVVARTPQPTDGRQLMTHPPVVHAGHVLVVDDSPSVRRVVSSMLKAHGWEVQSARDGVEALEAIARQAPVAVLLDIEMPRMDGYELMATIRSQQQYRHLPLIVLTSRAAAKHQQRAIQLGADAYVVKPYQDDELLETIDALIQSKAAQ